MKKIIVLGTIALASIILLGAGCAQKQTIEKPAGEQQKQAVAEQAVEEKNRETDLTISKEELDKLKNDIQALDVQDLNAPKN